jgi:hypothetical protein
MKKMHFTKLTKNRIFFEAVHGLRKCHLLLQDSLKEDNLINMVKCLCELGTCVCILLPAMYNLYVYSKDYLKLHAAVLSYVEQAINWRHEI